MLGVKGSERRLDKRTEVGDSGSVKACLKGPDKIAEPLPGRAAEAGSIGLFDGVCNLCTGAVRFILKRDLRGRFTFGSLQSDAGKRLLEAHGLPRDAMQTIVLIEAGRCFTKSDAVLRIARSLKGLWPVLAVLRIIPRCLRDAVYDFIARHRYRWFGKQSACMVPTEEEAGRFIV